MQSNSPVRELRSPRSCSPSCSASWLRRSSGWAPNSCRTPPRPHWKRRCTRRRPRSSPPLSEPWRRRAPMADFIIRIPRVSVAVAEAELTDLLVEAGDHVDEGTPIFVIATEKVEQEIEAGASGTGQWAGQIGTTYDIGAEIGVITSHVITS